MTIDRSFLKADIWEQWPILETDQKKGVPPPPVQKPYPGDAQLIELTPPHELTIGQMPLIEAIRRRRSRREFTSEPLSQEELAFLLWATQGASRTGPGPGDLLWRGFALLRTVPSGGARHTFETYLVVRRVTGLEPGLYRYLPIEHALYLVRPAAEVIPQAAALWSDRRLLSDSAVVFVWTTIPYRMEWRYGAISPKLIALDAGHVCQNLYLAAEAIGAGTCAVAAYNQKGVDALIGVDGEEEFAIYLAPVGKVGAQP